MQVKKLVLIISCSLLPCLVVMGQKKVSVDEVYKKALTALNQTQQYDQAMDLINEAIEIDPHYWDLYVVRGRIFALQNQPQQALQDWRIVLQHQPNNLTVLQYLYNLEVNRGVLQNALSYANKALLYVPNDQAWLLRKWDMQQQLQLPAANETLAQLRNLYPGEEKIKQLQVDQLLFKARTARNEGHYAEALQYYHAVLQIDPQQKDALEQSFNLSMGENRLQQAGDYMQLLRHQYPADTAYQFKYATVKAAQNQHDSALYITQNMASSNNHYRDFYIDQSLVAARKAEKADSLPLALRYLYGGNKMKPNDSTLLTQITRNYLLQSNYDSTLRYANYTLGLFPGETSLLRYKTIALENKNEYKAAYNTAKQVTPAEPGWQQYTKELKYQSYKNMIGVFRLQSFYSNNIPTASMTSVQYLRYFNFGTIAARVNYANRADDGVQAELEAYIKHGKKYYSYGIVSYAPNTTAFPEVRLGYSLFRSLPKDWEVELGIRYLRIDSANLYIPTASIAKSWNNYWVNIRNYTTFDNGTVYPVFALTNRYYFDDRRSYVTLLGGYGISPDDRSRNNLFNEIYQYKAYNIGAGIQKSIGYSTTLGFIANWTKQNLPRGSYNQYDFYISLQQRF
ncbi:YaiO family outer membrane protein [Chitinophaga skermanii]|uniref:YaiO family outer membrane protein n=1 Tax=Chitinophaga skermanii TaxID=331697 RepID=A0A327QWZ7_9BACT|nr:YaiO family outer membrane beta-barrel protein [Chitinophaga skermanii]RAJ08485.1 YaiO family outer membrane protein [Chitinophaga skermanii]